MNNKSTFQLLQFVIYRKNGKLVFNHKFTAGDLSQNLFGAIYATKNIVLAFDKSPEPQFNFYSTDSYSAHIFESQTGFIFILLTSTVQTPFYSNIRQFYQQIYTTYVVAQPGYTQTNPIFTELFIIQLTNWANQLK
ncbi:Longin-like domain-containing protein [Spironucleus salmonicida]|uniref:Trafficking protein particle complex subunit n=1 Tax=Spironucleus salmonicida TaxID=348837 RepID=V6LTQ4_9EUKA|nr:Longin-like domain-containing protein [Spironucleus salmonicida]|eukprot:EST47628.1 Sybindin-like family protein [Spironucleus salmonicida]